MLIMGNKKNVLIDSELHRKLKAKASLNKRTLQEELNRLIEENVEDLGDVFDNSGE